MYLIVIAMEEEAELLLNSLEYEIIKQKPYHLYKHQNFLLAITGIGLVNSAYVTTNVLSEYSLDCIFNLGAAGTTDPDLKINTVTLIDKAYYANADVRAFNYQYGQIPLEPNFFSTTSWDFDDLTMPTNNIASGDVFFDAVTASKIQVNLPKVHVFDMEATAIMHVASKYQIPVVVFKIISDIFNEPKPTHLQFQTNLAIMKEKVAEIGKRLITLYQDR